jgi:hypothetical protein
MLIEEHESFTFNTIGFKAIRGILLVGSAEVSLCYKNGKKIQIRSMNMSSLQDAPPNKRPIFFNKAITEEIIHGTIQKKTENGLVSIYLLLE